MPTGRVELDACRIRVHVQTGYCNCLWEVVHCFENTNFARPWQLQLELIYTKQCIYTYGINIFLSPRLPDGVTARWCSWFIAIFVVTVQRRECVSLPCYVNFKAFSNSSDVIEIYIWLSKFHSNFISSMFVVFHIFLWYWRNTFSSTFPWIFAVSFISLLICFKILYTSVWVLYVSCSKCVTNCPRRLCVFSLLF